MPAPIVVTMPAMPPAPPMMMPPPVPMPPYAVSLPIPATPAAVAPCCPAPVGQPVYPPSQDASIGVLRAVVVKAHESSTDDVVQTKHEVIHGHLEFKCEDGTKATFEKMTLHLPDGSPITFAYEDKQIVISGPSLKARCDRVAPARADGCLALQGHVELDYCKDGVKAHVEGSQILFGVVDGHLEFIPRKTR
jgi:hypothetical protein